MTTTRREFVTIGTIGLLGAKQLLAQSVMPETVQAAKPILSIGYWDGLMRGDGAENPTSHIFAANAVSAGSGFRNAAAMVTTYGFWRAPVNRSIPLSRRWPRSRTRGSMPASGSIALESGGETGAGRDSSSRLSRSASVRQCSRKCRLLKSCRPPEPRLYLHYRPRSG